MNVREMLNLIIYTKFIYNYTTKNGGEPPFFCLLLLLCVDFLMFWG